MSAHSELVGEVLGRVLYAARAEAEDALDAGASALAADPAAWDEVGRELLRRGEAFVRQAWERGWQPADVVRIVLRGGPDPVRVRLAADLIAAETRRYGDGQLDARWLAQLREAGAADGVAWADDGRFLETVAGREGLDRFGLVTALLEVLRLLIRLPGIEPVGPVPGAGAARTARVPAAPVRGEPRMLGRIRALLAKAEATDFPEEAEALSAKAQELMARYSISEALLGDASSPAAPGACRVGVDAPYESAKALLLDAVAEANRCRAVWSSELGFSTVVGFAGDLEAVELLYTSLLVQATAAMTRAEARQKSAGRKRTKTFRQSFLLAYATRVRQRLDEATERVTLEAAASEGALLPVLAARDVAVTDATDRMFPAQTTSRVRGARDYDGWTDGTAAADRAALA